MSTVDQPPAAPQHRPEHEGPPAPWSSVVSRWQTPMRADADPDAPDAPERVDRPPLWRKRWEAAAAAETGIFPGEPT